MMRLTRREYEVEECHMPETPETAAGRNGTRGHRSGPRPGVTEVGRPSVCEYTPARSPCDSYYGCARSCMCDCGTPTDMFVLSSDVTAVTMRRGF